MSQINIFTATEAYFSKDSVLVKDGQVWFREESFGQVDTDESGLGYLRMQDSASILFFWNDTAKNDDIGHPS